MAITYEDLAPPPVAAAVVAVGAATAAVVLVGAAEPPVTGVSVAGASPPHATSRAVITSRLMAAHKREKIRIVSYSFGWYRNPISLRARHARAE
jgi:hypothetical protein